MKTLLILFLTAALAAAAFFTRPAKREFVMYVLDTHVPRGLGGNSAVEQADQLVKGLTFKDRFLWTEAQRDGKTLYYGAFSHWFSTDGTIRQATPDIGALAKIVSIK